VKPRASRIALIVASVPELTRRTISSDGSSSHSSSAISTSLSVGAPKDSPLQRRLLDRGDHLGMRVPKDQRPPRADVIDVALAIGIDDARTGTGGEKARRTADRTKGPDRRVDATRDVPLRALKKLLIAGTHAFRP
jgi:hypothetical protein